MSTPSRLLLGMRVDSVGPEEALSTVLTWSRATRARVVCAANVHMIMEAVDDPGFRSIVNSADLVVPDGVPTVWALRALGVPCTGRVRVTPDWLFGLFSRLEVSGGVLSLYGGSQETLGIFKRQLTKHFPRLRLGASVLPPFRPMTDVEDATAVQEIVAADTSVLLVGIGCPKQERWMAEHRDSVPCVMIGVGAAFDLLGGRTDSSPAVDARPRSRVDLPASPGTAEAVAALPCSEPSIRGASRHAGPSPSSSDPLATQPSLSHQSLSSS